jgi:hypothetical protein
MPKTSVLYAILIAVMLLGLAAAALAQQDPDYRITAINVTPFEGQTGKFQAELKDVDERFFWNDLDISLLVVVEISGKPDGYSPTRKIVVTVTEGRKPKVTRTENPGVFNESGKFYVPVWVYPSMCSEIRITARVTGQRTTSTKTRNVPFNCGE